MGEEALPTLQKTIQWEEKRRQIDEIADATGRGIDEGIKETVVAFNLAGIPTSQSCEGHDELKGGHRPWPWVDIAAPDEPGERFEGESELFRKAAEEHAVNLDDLKRGSPEDLYWQVVTKASQNPVRAEYFTWEQQNTQLHDIVSEVLAQFYVDRVVEEGSRLKLDEDTGGTFELSSEKDARHKLFMGELTVEDRRVLIENFQVGERR